MQIHLQSGALSAVIDSFGAQLISLCKNSEEYIWQRDPRFWPECCPIGSVKNFSQFCLQSLI